MIATVTYPYRDRETLEVHHTGDEVELTAERFAELSAEGYVDAPSQAEPEEPEESEEQQEPEPEEPEESEEQQEPEPEEPEESEEPQEMTAAQMRAEIESMGGFAPKKATKAQLAELMESL